MARDRRRWEPGTSYHLFSRGSNRQPIFRTQGDYFEFAFLLASAAHKHEVDCFAWAFLPNHWHLLARSPEVGLSSFVRELNHRYALRFNRRNGRTAHLFKNRFGCVEQTSQAQFLGTTRYILWNPPRSGLATSVETADWTSFKATVGAVPAPPFLRVGELLENFGARRTEALRAFRDFVCAEREL